MSAYPLYPGQPGYSPIIDGQTLGELLSRVNPATLGAAVQDQPRGGPTIGQALSGRQSLDGPLSGFLPVGSLPSERPASPEMMGNSLTGSIGNAVESADDLDTISRNPADMGARRPEPFSPDSIVGGLSNLPQPQQAVQPVRAETPDYEKLRKQLAGEIKDPGTFSKVMMILGPMLASFGGNDALAGAMIGNVWDQRRDREKRLNAIDDKIAGWQYDDWERADEARKKAAEPYSLNNRRLAFDPDTGSTNTLYTAPQDWEDYAAALGLTPGSDAYKAAMQDYVLKTSGPTAHQYDLQLDDYRTNNDIRVEGVRQGNRTELEGVRQGNRERLEGVRQQGRESLRGTLTAEQQARLRGPRGERPAKVVTDGKGNYQGLINGRWTPLALPNQQEY